MQITEQQTSIKLTHSF